MVGCPPAACTSNARSLALETAALRRIPCRALLRPLLPFGDPLSQHLYRHHRHSLLHLHLPLPPNRSLPNIQHPVNKACHRHQCQSNQLRPLHLILILLPCQYHPPSKACCPLTHPLAKDCCKPLRRDLSRFWMLGFVGQFETSRDDANLDSCAPVLHFLIKALGGWRNN
eukprot:1157887-Pelagomonas_calceolata.AAC.5